jgi:hypothetical protein
MTIARWGSWATLVAFAVVAAGCGDDDDSGGQSLCRSSCQAEVAANCPGFDTAQCTARCEQGLAATSCTGPTEQLLRCVAALPATEFECNADGTATMSQSACTQELMNLATQCTSGDAGADLYALACTETAAPLCYCTLAATLPDGGAMASSCSGTYSCCIALSMSGHVTACMCSNGTAAQCQAWLAEYSGAPGETAALVPTCPVP